MHEQPEIVLLYNMAGCLKLCQFLMYASFGAGLALCYRCPIGIRLSRCFLKMLTCRETHLSDYAQVDLQVCNGLQAIACANQQELRDMQLTFEPPDGTAFAQPHGEVLPSAFAEHCTRIYQGKASCVSRAACTCQWTLQLDTSGHCLQYILFLDT